MNNHTGGARGWLRQRTAEEIRVLLARKRMSAAELARKAGLKQSTLARRMSGEVSFNLDDLEMIACALKVDVTELLPPTRRRRTIDCAITEPARPGQRRDSARPVSTPPPTRS